MYFGYLQNITETFEIKDDRKCISLPAIDIFKHAIKALKDHFKEAARGRGVVFKPEEVLYVLTVPAIWSESAKEFMKKAAIKVYLLYIFAFCINSLLLKQTMLVHLRVFTISNEYVRYVSV